MYKTALQTATCGPRHTGTSLSPAHIVVGLSLLLLLDPPLRHLATCYLKFYMYDHHDYKVAIAQVYIYIHTQKITGNISHFFLEHLEKLDSDSEVTHQETHLNILILLMT